MRIILVIAMLCAMLALSYALSGRSPEPREEILTERALKALDENYGEDGRCRKYDNRIDPESLAPLREYRKREARRR